MRRPGGYATWTSPDDTIERDTFTCCHCNYVVIVKARQQAADAGGFCRLCMKPTCGPCADKGVCTPFEKKLEAQERRYNLWKAMERQ